MEQFSLEKYLEKPSCKVVTRDGRPVRILDCNLKGDKHICIAIDDKTQESITTVDEDGHCLKDGNQWYECVFDLFFADEEEELTEFEKAVQSICKNLRDGIDDISDIHVLSNNLLDLARKELQPEFDKEMDKMLAETDKVVYQKGQQDVLKSLPKWKRDCFHNITSVVNGRLFYNGYYIDINELKTLPKEE